MIQVLFHFPIYKLSNYICGRFHKAKTLAFFYWQENANKIVSTLKYHFLATNIWQHVVNLSVFVAHFVVKVTHFGIFNAKFEL